MEKHSSINSLVYCFTAAVVSEKRLKQFQHRNVYKKSNKKVLTLQRNIFAKNITQLVHG